MSSSVEPQRRCIDRPNTERRNVRCSGQPSFLSERSGIHGHAVVDLAARPGLARGDAKLETARKKIAVIRDADELAKLVGSDVDDRLGRFEATIAALQYRPFAHASGRRAADDETTVGSVDEERTLTRRALFF